MARTAATLLVARAAGAPLAGDAGLADAVPRGHRAPHDQAPHDHASSDYAPHGGDIATVTDPLAGLIGDLAVQVLVDEATLSPKPGLVDARGSGAHDDLTLALMTASALALRPAFIAMASAGLRATAIDQSLRERLGALGREAEATMLQATGGINTHRGAIWCIGLLAGAAGWLRRGTGRPVASLPHMASVAPVAPVAQEPDMACGVATYDRAANEFFACELADAAGRIARLPDRLRPTQTGHKGELACQTYGVNGARGQAEAAFPHVVHHGLPTLQQSRARGDTEPCARLNALLAIMAHLDDTCVLARAGTQGLAHMQGGAMSVLDAGGAGTLAGRRLLRQLEAGMLARKASPGGAADLLAATLFLDRMPSPMATPASAYQGE